MKFPHPNQMMPMSLVIPVILMPLFFRGEVAIAETVSKKVALENIEHIQLLGTYKLSVSQGDDEYVILTTDSKDLNKVDAKMQGRKLALGRVNVSYGLSRDDEDIDASFELQVKNLKSISNMGVGQIVIGNVRSDDDISISNMGAGRFEIESLQGNEIEFNNFGAGFIEVKGLVAEQLSENSLGAGKSSYSNITADEIELTTVGGSRINFSGSNSASEVEINASGATTIDAEALRAQKVEIEASGASTVRITVLEEMEVEASGSSRVIYSGEPSIKKSTNGTASVTSSGK